MYKGERINSISHLIGACPALAGLALLVASAGIKGDPWKIVSFSVYGGSLVVLYTLSTLYHSLKGKAKLFFQKLDHAAIYLLIAGTYTPFTLVSLRGAPGLDFVRRHLGAGGARHDPGSYAEKTQSDPL